MMPLLISLHFYFPQKSNKAVENGKIKIIDCLKYEQILCVCVWQREEEE